MGTKSTAGAAGPDHWRNRCPAHLVLCAGSDRGDALSAVSHSPTGFLCANDGNYFLDCQKWLRNRNAKLK